MNAIQLLKEDHRKLRILLSELEDTTKRATKRRRDLLTAIAILLEGHTRIEEEIFYPALRESAETTDDEKMFFEALEEHRAVGKLVLPDLMKTALDSDQFSGRAKVLKELIEHHAGDEESEMFPRVRELLTAAQLRALGERMDERRREISAGITLGAVKRASDRLIGAIASAVSPEEARLGRSHGDGHQRANGGRRSAAGARSGARPR